MSTSVWLYRMKYMHHPVIIHVPPTADPRDRPFLLGQKQFVIWSMGPVGSLDTPLGTTIPVPFRHYAQADRSGNNNIGYLSE